MPMRYHGSYAVRMIEEYEEQERKHTENVKMQGRMFWLTLTIALLTLVQAGLVKLPPLFDFTSESSVPKSGITNHSSGTPNGAP